MSIRRPLAALLPALALALVGAAGSTGRAADPPAAVEVVNAVDTVNAADAADAAEQPLAGHWSYAGDAAEAKAISAAIEASIQNLQGPLRDLARRRLQDTNGVPGTIVLDLGEAAQKVSVSLDRRTIRTRAGRTVLFTDPHGNTSRVSHRVDEGALHERLIAVDGERRNDFVLADGGARLTLKVRIQSPHLAQPVTYSLTYARR